MKVRVSSGDGRKDLGEGELLGTVTVYAWLNPDGTLEPLKDAERPPTPEEIPAGVRVMCIGENPKIRLASGEIVYGCQVWWEPLGGDN